MKSYLPTILFQLISSSSFAQTEKGNFVISGKTDINFLFSKITTGSDSVQTSETKATQYGVAAGAGYFVTDNLSMGISGTWSYNYTRTGASNYLPSNTEAITRLLTVLPQLQYYFPSKEKLRPFAIVGAGYAWMEQSDSQGGARLRLLS